MISHLGRSDVIVPIWRQQGDGGKTIKNLVAGLRTRKALKKLLKDEAGGQNSLASLNRLDEYPDFRGWGRPIASKSKRPNACIDEKTQWRFRSAL